MPQADYENLRVRVRSTPPALVHLWREWCFFRVILVHFRVRFAVMIGILLTGGLLFKYLDPARDLSLPKAMYFTWSLVFGEPPEEFPDHVVLQSLFFIIPVLGLLVILEGLVDFAFILRDRRRHERSWCKVMAAALRNHIILVGLGKLGYRAYRLLRQLGAPVVVIERNGDNQFLDELRRDGTPLLIGDARREALLVDAHAAAARSIIVATNDDLANLEIALDARRIQPGIRVVLRMFDQNMADKIRGGFNLQVAMSQSAMSAPAFVMAALESSIVSSTVIGQELVVIQRWRAHAGGPLAGHNVAELMRTYGVVVVERSAPGSTPHIMPGPDTVIAAGDQLLVQGTFDRLRNLADEVQGLAAAAAST
ncbi:MAG: potassium channel protein [Phycisphaerales bacterium]|nr:potassium channel protein [Phycisphaerales bacterium]